MRSAALVGWLLWATLLLAAACQRPASRLPARPAAASVAAGAALPAAGEPSGGGELPDAEGEYLVDGEYVEEASDDGESIVEASDDDDDTPRPTHPLPPGCSYLEATARDAELAALGKRIERLAPLPIEAPAALAELSAILARPCLAHGAPALRLPKATSMAALREAWFYSMLNGLRGMLKLPVEHGVRVFTVPPEIRPTLDDAVRRKLAPLLCRKQEPACQRAVSYVARAEQTFNAAYRRRLADYTVHDGAYTKIRLPTELCDGTWDRNEERRPETFEAWASCLDARTPSGYRFAADVRWRSLERGWLLLRAHRGHFQYVDEIRAYDLATGAAYVVVLDGSMLAAPDEPVIELSPPATLVGVVAADQLRELTFYLMARPALVAVRGEQVLARVPASIPLARAPRAAVPTRASWAGPPGNQYQTKIDYVYFDGAERHRGTFLWPEDQEGIDGYADDLLRVMEAGLVPGCAPASLPTTSQLRGPDGDSISGVRAPHTGPGDARLEKLLDSLRGQACKGAP